MVDINHKFKLDIHISQIAFITEGFTILAKYTRTYKFLEKKNAGLKNKLAK